MTGAPAGRVRFLAWLVRRSVRADWRRSLLTVTVGFMGVLIFLSGAAALPAAQDQSDTTASTLSVPSSLASDSGHAGLLISSSKEFYRDRLVHGTRIAAVGRTSLRPPGVDTLPPPGDLVVSPALRDALMGDPVLRERISGEVVGLIGRSGLAAPRQLTYYEGVAATDLADAPLTVAFQDASTAGLQAPSAVRAGAPFMVIIFLVPLLALFAIIATMGSDRRERRLSALRLLGLRAGEARTVAVTEAVVLGLISGVAGLVFFAVVAPRLAPVVPLGSGAWPDQIRLPVWAALGAVLVLPAVGGLVVGRASRGSVLDPVQTARATPAEPPVSRWGGWCILAGLVGVALAEAARVLSGVTAALAVLAVSLMVSLIGILVGSRWVNRAAAQRLAQQTRRPDLLIAGRYVSRHPRSASRVATGVALLVFFGGFLLFFFPLLSDADAEAAVRLEHAIGAHTLLAAAPTPAAIAAIRERDGVGAVVEMASDGSGSIISCPGLAALVGTEDRHGSGADRVVAALVENQYLPYGSEPRRGDIPNVDWGPSSPHAVAVVPAPGTDPEVIRTAMIRDGMTDVVTANEYRAVRQLDTQTFQQATLLALLCAALVALGSLLAGLVDHLNRQGRSFRMLAVIGVSRRQLTRSLLAQTTLSVVPAVGLAWLIGLVSAAEFLRLNDTSHLSPDAIPSLSILLVALALPLAATLLAARHLKTLTRERTEA